jgi:outer membrane protein assembly factor BamB
MDTQLGRCTGLLVAVGALLATGCEDPVVEAFDYAASSPIYSTPAITKDGIFFGSENGEVVALNKKGEFQWKYATRRDVRGAVKVSENMVYFGSTNNNFYALDLNGHEVWKFIALSRIKGDPLILGKTVIFGSYDKHVYAVNALNGRREWVFPDDLDTPPAATPPPAEKDVKDPKAKDPKAAATPAPAEPAVPVEEKIAPGDAFSYSSPVLVGENIVMGNLDGYVYAIHSKTGKLSWRFKTDGADSKKGVTSTVVETPDALVFGANDGQVYAISKDGKATKWKFKTGDEINATATLDPDGSIYIGGVDGYFYALSAAGQEKWKYQLKGPVMGRSALVDNLVVFAGGTGDNSVYAVDKATGKLFWTTLTNGKIETDVVAEGNRIYVASGDRRLFCFQFNKTRP